MSAPNARVVERRLPATFRSLTTLRVLNVLAVGFSLAAATGAVLGRMIGSHDDEIAALTTLPTLFFGIVWAVLLRHRATVGRRKLRWGWIASLPLAVANSATAAGLVAIFTSLDGAGLVWRFIVGAAIGATFGAIVWIPALFATLLCFGAPIAWAQGRAEKGLAGEESGELVVGSISAVIGLAAFALLAGQTAAEGGGRLDPVTATAIYAFVLAVALIGAAAGVTAAALALRRERARRTFVREVEAGAMEGFRVDESVEGKVLVRVSSIGEGYRVANVEEPMFELAATGEAQRRMAARD